ncbi:clathrin light chain binding [Trichomonas vaginalis G3]|uniref:clathrin light chain binding n=1 Tax=Trichomonas vaginalis (strain ATCC PRA-98 / G3) TaxID=412133 RepID=UPI0021E52BAA|nr:clathrin light chain binding [Trichomonas vaginalis G3]KAI5507016.1 clathrin light chain binding [Trichomonas vaginalis G3]
MSQPIFVNEVFSFASQNMDPRFAVPSNSAVSKDKYLCVREENGPESSVAIIDLQQGNQITRHKMCADAAVMHPSRNVIALRGNNALQVFDLNTRQRLKSFTVPENMQVTYWKFVDDDTLMFVVGNAVFHWTMSQNNNPVQVFQLLPQLANTQIIGYAVSQDKQWYLLSGLTQENNQIVGKLQIYSNEHKVSQVIDAFNGVFANIGNLQLLAFASKAGNMKLNIFPLGSSPEAQSFGRKFQDLQAPPDAQDDLPLYVLFSQKYNSIYMVTRGGLLYMMELQSATVYLSVRIANTPQILANSTTNGGILALGKDGRLVSIAINNDTIVDYITQRAGAQVAAKVAANAGIHMSNDFITQ